MKIIPIPVKYEWVEKLFGTYIADNFNNISIALMIVGFFIWSMCRRKTEVRTEKKRVHIPEQRQINYCIDENGHIIPDKSQYEIQIENYENEEKPIQEEYFGQYDRYENLTDEELKLAMKIRLNREEPTYEEWRANRLKEKAQEEAASPKTPTE